MNQYQQIMKWWDSMSIEQRIAWLSKHNIETSLAYNSFTNLPPQALIWIENAIRAERQQQSPQQPYGNPGTKCVAPGCSKPAVTTLYIRGIPYKVCLSHYAQYQR